jgi:hypothetical protein
MHGSYDMSLQLVSRLQTFEQVCRGLRRSSL